MQLLLKRYSLLAILLVLLPSLAYTQTTIVINEFMSDNESTLEDEDGDYSDWIELYNTSTDPINLFGYTLSDDNNNLQKWSFPSIILPPQDFLLVFASGKNRLDTNELHTNFKISSSGEELFLSNYTGQIIDQIEPIELEENQVYGRLPDGFDNFLLLPFITPKSSNKINNQLIFEFKSGFYSSPFFQKITSLLNDTIYYTVDGSMPNVNSNIFIDSLLMDYKYNTPNYLSNFPTTPEQDLLSYKAWEPPSQIMDKANIIRFASYRNGERTSDIVTHTYFVDSTIHKKYTMPIISLVTESKNLFDYEKGIYTPGIHYDINEPEWTGNYFQRGELWERPVHIEYFEQDGNIGFSQNAGIEIHGGKTRQAAQKSFRLSAKDQYGKKYFDYPLMPNRPQIQYKNFLLKGTMGSWEDAIISDVFAHVISKDLNINYQDYRPVIVYLNGEYWGIQTIRDRIDERYLGYSYGLDSDSIEFRGYFNLPYLYLMEYIEENDLSNPLNYDSVKTRIDIKNFIDYYIAEMFLRNIDWPVNNKKLWIEKNSNGIWRWVFFDIDAGFGDFNYNMFEHVSKNDSTIIAPNSPSSTFLFRNLIKNQDFKNQFVNRYSEVLRTDFHRDTLTKRLDEIVATYDPEINKHISRWNYPSSYEDWKNAILQKIQTFIDKRHCIVENNMVEFFDLTTYDFICTEENGVMQNSKFRLFPNPNDGNFKLYNVSDENLVCDLIIVDVLGKIIYQENNSTFDKDEFKKFNLNLPSGNYFFSIKNSDFNNSIKFIIAN